MRCLLALLCTFIPSVSLADRRPLHYAVDLDGDPRTRWHHVVRDHQQHVDELRDAVHVLQTLDSQLADTKRFADENGGMWRRISDEHKMEMKGISESAGIPMTEMLMLTAFYDLSAWDLWSFLNADSSKEEGDIAKHYESLREGKSAEPLAGRQLQQRSPAGRRLRLFGCTSIVARTGDGRMLHARNFDYDFGSLLKDLTISVEFRRGGKRLYDAVMIAFTVFVLTGQRRDAFSISLNQRERGSIEENLYMAFHAKEAHIVGLLIRDTLEKTADYETAFERLRTAPLIAPCYLAIAGPKSGAIITRARTRTMDIWRITEKTEYGWYALATNYDRWKEVPTSDQRRPAAKRILLGRGRSNTDIKALYKLLSTPPVLNKGTVFSCVMSPSEPAVLGKLLWIRDAHGGNATGPDFGFDHGDA